MSKPSKPAWPSPGAFPFMSFPIPGFAPPAAPAAAPASGLDLLGSVWGSLPGTSQIPGFLVPTIDVDELDKRIADLKAAQAWVEVNLNLLRATIQGLEVQRHTIAALRSFSTVPEAASPPKPPPAVAPPVSRSVPEPPAPAPVAAQTAPQVAPTIAPQPGIAAGQWLGYLQDQFAKVAEAALGAAAPNGGTAPAAKRAPPVAEKPARKAAAPRKRRPAAR
jgi:hypothetical protein